MFGLGENPISMHHRSDYQSIQSDWLNIGKDISVAMQKYEKQQAN